MLKLHIKWLVSFSRHTIESLFTLLDNYYYQTIFIKKQKKSPDADVDVILVGVVPVAALPVGLIPVHAVILVV